MGGKLEPEAFHRLFQTGLGRRIPAQPHTRRGAGIRSDGDNGAFAAYGHLPGRQLHEEQCRGQVDVDHLAQIGLGRVEQARRFQHARRID